MKKIIDRILSPEKKYYYKDKIFRLDVSCYPIFFWTKTKWYKNLLAKLIQKTKLTKINVGCGPEGVLGWLNIGILPSSKFFFGKPTIKNDIYYLNYDLTYGLPFKKGSIEYIYGSHFIEHLNFDQGMKFFREAYNVLKRNGIIRISCPDLEKYALKYIQKDREFYQKQLKQFCFHPQAKTSSEIFIAKAYDGKLHKWFYDKESLRHLMQKAGFRTINDKTVHQSKINDIKKVEPKFREIESLYIEAIK